MNTVASLHDYQTYHKIALKAVMSVKLSAISLLRIRNSAANII